MGQEHGEGGPSDTGQETQFLRCRDIDKRTFLPLLPLVVALALPSHKVQSCSKRKGGTRPEDSPPVASGLSSLGFLVWPGLGERVHQLRENSPARENLGESECLSNQPHRFHLESEFRAEPSPPRSLSLLPPSPTEQVGKESLLAIYGQTRAQSRLASWLACSSFSRPAGSRGFPPGQWLWGLHVMRVSNGKFGLSVVQVPTPPLGPSPLRILQLKAK